MLLSSWGFGLYSSRRKLLAQAGLKFWKIWKAYMWTAEWRIKWWMIISVIYATSCSCEKKARKKKRKRKKKEKAPEFFFRRWSPFIYLQAGLSGNKKEAVFKLFNFYSYIKFGVGGMGGSKNYLKEIKRGLSLEPITPGWANSAFANGGGGRGGGRPNIIISPLKLIS